MTALPPPLLMTMGDPDGLGPELICRLFARPRGERGKAASPILIIGPESALSAHLAGGKPFWQRLDGPDDPVMASDRDQGRVYLYTPPELENFAPRPGQGREEGGFAAGTALNAACDLLVAGRAKAVVTLPLNKAMLKKAGFDFPGHTEFLARRAGLNPEDVCMHLCGDRLRVSLVTTHPPLSLVPGMITGERILHCLRLTEGVVRALARAEVRDRPVAVCGLNPHAGEEGTIGREELDIIGPAVEQARAQGLNAEGPFPGDTIFYRAAQGEFSGVLAMYHDQGLAPLKLLHFHEAVNITLGLPFVRTSVDHGTGYDITGTGKAALGSLEAALDAARRLLLAARD